jgi:hypothetical protein
MASKKYAETYLLGENCIFLYIFLKSSAESRKIEVKFMSCNAVQWFTERGFFMRWKSGETCLNFSWTITKASITF